MKRKADDALSDEPSNSSKRAKYEIKSAVLRGMESGDMVRHISTFLSGDDLNAWTTTSRALHFDQLLASTRKLLYEYYLMHIKVNVSRFHELRHCKEDHFFSSEHELVSVLDMKQPLLFARFANGAHAVVRFSELVRAELDYTKRSLSLHFPDGEVLIYYATLDNMQCSLDTFRKWELHCLKKKHERLKLAAATATAAASMPA